MSEFHIGDQGLFTAEEARDAELDACREDILRLDKKLRIAIMALKQISKPALGGKLQQFAAREALKGIRAVDEECHP